MPAFLYFPGEHFSPAELSAACLDGHLVSLGEACIPADAPETPWMRAASLTPLLGTTLAATRRTAAWVYGACAELPGQLDAQRAVPRRLHQLQHPRLRYHDVELPPTDWEIIGGLKVATLARTIADFARTAEDDTLLQILAREQPSALDDAAAWLENATRYPGIRRARTRLAALQRDERVGT